MCEITPPSLATYFVCLCGVCLLWLTPVDPLMGAVDPPAPSSWHQEVPEEAADHLQEVKCTHDADLLTPSQPIHRYCKVIQQLFRYWTLEQKCRTTVARLEWESKFVFPDIDSASITQPHPNEACSYSANFRLVNALMIKQDVFIIVRWICTFVMKWKNFCANIAKLSPVKQQSGVARTAGWD